MNVLVTLLKSKRTWVMIVTLALHLLAKYHVVLSDADVSAIADQCVLIAGAAAVVGTKVIDSRNADLNPQLPINGNKIGGQN